MENPNSEARCGIEVAMSTSQIHRRELIQTLEGLKDRISADEPGCEVEVFEDLREANRFLWSEWWPTLADADRAQASDRFRALLGAVKVLGTLESVRRVRQRPTRNAHRPNQQPIESGT
jgi:quinol monooxygenase YgiN